MKDVSKLLIIGDGPIYALANAIAQRTCASESLSAVIMPPDAIATADFAFLDAYDGESLRVFAAIGTHALNYARFDLWAKLRIKGVRFATLVHPAADVEPNAKVGENVLIGAFACIEADAEIGSGTVVSERCSIASGARIGRFSWLARGASLGSGAQVGSHVILGERISVADGTRIGSDCEVSVPGNYDEDLRDGTFISPHFSAPVRMFKGVKV